MWVEDRGEYLSNTHPSTLSKKNVLSGTIKSFSEDSEIFMVLDLGTIL